MYFIEKALVKTDLLLKEVQLNWIDGNPVFERSLLQEFLSTPRDICPQFEGFRGKDHPRYGRFVYSFARRCKPELIVEVGTYAGGTAAGWARALAENSRGRLICVDNDSYVDDTYPRVTRINLERAGLEAGRYELRSGDSRAVIPQIAQEHTREVDIYLVDGDHTYEYAQRDLENGLPMLKPGGFILVHDLDRKRKMTESTSEHPFPVYEAFFDFVRGHGFQCCILRFIRKHLGIIQVNP